MNESRDTKERIRFLRSLTGLTAKEFCERYGVSHSSYTKWEAGFLPISASKAKTLIAIAEQSGIYCTLSWLLHGTGQVPQEQKHITNQTPEEISEPHIAIAKEQEFFKRTYKNSEILVICDKSMEPQYKIGEYVGGTCVDLKKIKKYLDYPCIVTTDDGKVRLRRIGYNSKNFFLFGTNTRYAGGPLFEHSPKIIKLAPIFWHRMTRPEQ